MRKITTVIAIGICLAVFVAGSPAWAGDQLQATEYQVTATSDAYGYTTPVIGQDAIGTYIVYVQYPIVNGVAGNARIYYQRVANSQPSGSPVVVADSSMNQYLNDAYGDYIVYSLSPAWGLAGNIVLYQISTNQGRVLTTTGDCYSPRIFGDYVVWLERLAVGTQVLFYQISSGVPVQTSLIAGPTPSIGDATIGGRFIVWSQIVNNQFDVGAYDMSQGFRELVTNTPNLNEDSLSMDGNWIAWEASSTSGTGGIAIQAENLDTGEIRTIADSGASNQRPQISGNLISYESNVSGKFQIYIYRIAEGDTFQVTNSTYDERLNNIQGNLVTYVDNRTGNYNVYAANLSFVATPPPTANAGPNQTVHEGSTVTLDGSGSSAPSGLGPLTYAWSFGSTPANSKAVLSDPAAVKPSFTVDLTGDYVVQLIVTDSAGVASTPSSVTISTTNSPPIASAAASPQAVTLIGSKIQLDGNQSYDPDGDPITYQWSFVSIPQGSNAKLSDPTIVKPTFIADVHGAYQVQLIVSDPWVPSKPTTVTISFNNIAPVANAGTSQSAIVGDTVTLNGSGSSDANGDPLTYLWSFASVPAGSASSIASPTSVKTTFVPDLPGLFVAQLIVNDGFVDSVASTVQVQVITRQTEAAQQTQNIQNIIASLNPSVLKNANMQNALINQLNAALGYIDTGDYADALGQLQEILGKMDGCATTGAPDKNDWIKTCAAQNQVYPYVMKLIQLVRSM
jgi:hypothetical protein